MTPWKPGIGAWLCDQQAHFRVWAPGHRRIELVRAASTAPPFALEPREDGTFAGTIDVPAGTRYAYLVDGAGPFPDPASPSTCAARR